MITFRHDPASPPEVNLQGYTTWRQRQVTVLEATAQVGEQQRWLQWCNSIQPNDELWYFKSPLETWQRGTGRAGYYILRNGAVVDVIVTYSS